MGEYRFVCAQPFDFKRTVGSGRRVTGTVLDVLTESSRVELARRNDIMIVISL